MVTSTKELIRMVNDVVQEYASLALQVPFTKANGVMINLREMVFYLVSLTK
jgi:hypothetical protein